MITGQNLLLFEKKRGGEGLGEDRKLWVFALGCKSGTFQWQCPLSSFGASFHFCNGKLCPQVRGPQCLLLRLAGPPGSLLGDPLNQTAAYSSKFRERAKDHGIPFLHWTHSNEVSYTFEPLKRSIGSQDTCALTWELHQLHTISVYPKWTWSEAL